MSAPRAGAPQPPRDDAIVVNARIAIPRTELDVRATRAGGPGGQHVNTSSTRIELRWNVRTTQALDEERRARVLEKLAGRLDGEGALRIVASEHRSQRQNREAAEARLANLVREALVVPKVRRPTRPTRASVRERLDSKRRASEKKQQRRAPADE